MVILLIIKTSYGSKLNKVVKVKLIIGIDNEMIITLPAKSTLFAIALSPLSLQILTVYSTKIEIPVIFKRSPINSEL